MRWLMGFGKPSAVWAGERYDRGVWHTAFRISHFVVFAVSSFPEEPTCLYRSTRKFTTATATN